MFFSNSVMWDVYVQMFTNEEIVVKWKNIDNSYGGFHELVENQETGTLYKSKFVNDREYDNRVEIYQRNFLTPIPTGVYTLYSTGTYEQHSMKVVLSAVGTLFSGTCFLIDGNDIGTKETRNLWMIMTNYHVVSHYKNNLPNVRATICCQSVNLRPDLFYKDHTNENEGLDYAVVAIDPSQQQTLTQFRIKPNTISSSAPNFYKDEAVLIHKPHASNTHLYTACKINKRHDRKTTYTYVGQPSSGGSSGSPVFGIDANGNMSVHGLHREFGACINMYSIINDITAALK